MGSSWLRKGGMCSDSEYCGASLLYQASAEHAHTHFLPGFSAGGHAWLVTWWSGSYPPSTPSFSVREEEKQENLDSWRNTRHTCQLDNLPLRRHLIPDSLTHFLASPFKFFKKKSFSLCWFSWWVQTYTVFSYEFHVSQYKKTVF